MSLKICVYAIAKNEERHVERFMSTAREADYVCVLDTGSTDKTVELLEGQGAIVRRGDTNPWRFDTARNESMKLIPPDTDVCVCLDLDEVLNAGWRVMLETAWTEDTEAGRYTCVCGRNADGTPSTSFLRDKIHRQGLFRWMYPVHEVLTRTDGKASVTTVITDMVAEHLPDNSKSRAGYLPLLELAAAEMPEDARSAHYLGREYMYAGRWSDAIAELKRHLALPSAVWDEERCASMRYISDCCHCMGNLQTAMSWALRALAELPESRESRYACEKAAYYLNDWRGVVYYGELADSAKTRSDTCINEAEAWGAAVYDLLTIGYWHTGQHDKALEAAERAMELDAGNERIRANVEMLRKGAARHDDS